MYSPISTLARAGLALSWLAFAAPAVWAQAAAPKPAPSALAAPAVVAPAPAVAVPAANDPNAIRVLLSPELETTLVSQMLGRIATLNASLGARVVKGRPIVVFDCGEPRARLRMVQAESDAASEQLQVKQRLRTLDAAGDSEVTQAAMAAERAKAAIALTQVQLGQCTVPAPFTGQVVKIHVKPHQGVNVGMPLLEMVSDGPLKLRLNVPSRLLRTLKVGTPFDVVIDETGRSYTAKVTAINARVDAVAQSIEMEARIDGQHPELLAGMSGVARFK